MANFKRVTKPIARKMFYSGITIYVLPCKVNESALNCNGFIQPAIFDITRNAIGQENKFDRLVNEYIYYNCNSELGYYPHYFVTETDFASYQMCNVMC